MRSWLDTCCNLPTYSMPVFSEHYLHDSDSEVLCIMHLTISHHLRVCNLVPHVTRIGNETANLGSTSHSHFDRSGGWVSINPSVTCKTIPIDTCLAFHWLPAKTLTGGGGMDEDKCCLQSITQIISWSKCSLLPCTMNMGGGAVGMWPNSGLGTKKTEEMVIILISIFVENQIHVYFRSRVPDFWLWLLLPKRS